MVYHGFSKNLVFEQRKYHIESYGGMDHEKYSHGQSKEILSRGLVVLFEEPQNKKVTDLLTVHGIPCEEKLSREFSEEEVDEHTLILTMNFPEKVKIVEDYELEENVYTLKEFVGEEGDVLDPYGGDEDAYEECVTQN